MKRLRTLLMLVTGFILVSPVLSLAQVRAEVQVGQGYDRDRDGDRDRWHDRDDYRFRGLGVARRFGYDDGFNDGAFDRRTGHSYRPTHSGNFRHADRGYDGRFVSRYDYKIAYRDSYEEGYRRGYESAGWRRY